MIYQTDKMLNKEINKYGCAFCCLAYAREKLLKYKWTANELNELWEKAKKLGFVSGDVNKDGDVDDNGEAEILNWQGLADLMQCNLQYIPGYFNPSAAGIVNHYYICAWYNKRTKFTHFVVGTKKPVEYDPIGGGSVTVKEGSPRDDGLRIFRIL